MDIPEQVCITRDNVQVAVDGILYLKVMDPERASYGISNYIFAITQLAQTTLRSEIGKIELDRTFEERSNINIQVVTEVDKASEAWGVKVLRYEIKNITPPADIIAAMEKQMRAEREKRAVILQSEGERDAAINNAEGQKQQVIKASEAKKQQQINEAEGQAAAIQAVARATAEGIRAVAAVHPGRRRLRGRAAPGGRAVRPPVRQHRERRQHPRRPREPVRRRLDDRLGHERDPGQGRAAPAAHAARGREPGSVSLPCSGSSVRRGRGPLHEGGAGPRGPAADARTRWSAGCAPCPTTTRRAGRPCARSAAWPATGPRTAWRPRSSPPPCSSAHGFPPLLMSLESQDHLDHVIFVFRENGRCGSVAARATPGSTAASRSSRRRGSSPSATWIPCRGPDRTLVGSASPTCASSAATTGASRVGTCWKVERWLDRLPARARAHAGTSLPGAGTPATSATSTGTVKSPSTTRTGRPGSRAHSLHGQVERRRLRLRRSGGPRLRRTVRGLLAHSADRRHRLPTHR